MQHHKTSRRNHRITTSNIDLGNSFFVHDTKNQARRAQIYKGNCIKKKKILHRKGNNQENKDNLQIGENIHISYLLQDLYPHSCTEFKI